MAIALRRPYADELLATLIVEYLADEKVAHRDQFLRSLLGCGSLTSARRMARKTSASQVRPGMA